MAQFVLSSEQLLEQADRMAQSNNEIQQIFQEIASRMRQTQTYWDSPAARNMMSRFESFSPSFDSYVEILMQYVSYLRMMAQSYQEMEAMMMKG